MNTIEIKNIIKCEVTKAWECLCLYSETFDMDDEITVRARAKWVALDNLWDKLFPSEEY